MARTFPVALLLVLGLTGLVRVHSLLGRVQPPPRSAGNRLFARSTYPRPAREFRHCGWFTKSLCTTNGNPGACPLRAATDGEGDQGAESGQGKSLFVFGIGYVATAVAFSFLRKGWTVYGTCTDPRKVKSLGEQGIKAFIFDDFSGPMMQPEPLEALSKATCVLSTVPPTLQTGVDPVLRAHEPELEWAFSQASLKWIGYLSSTGVYGERGGGWVTEDDEPWPLVARTKARLKAERSWLRLHSRSGMPVHVFRLAGIYGPGRSALDAVARHSGDIRLAGADDGTHVSRVHVHDIVNVLEASVEAPDPGTIINVADDLPSTRYETLAFGCKLLGYPRQDPDPEEKNINRRGGGNKRVDNGRMQALLARTGRTLTFADYRIGLSALYAGDGRPFSPATPGIEMPPGRANPSNIQVSWPGWASVRPEAGVGELEAEVRALSQKVDVIAQGVERLLEITGLENLARGGTATDEGTLAASTPDEQIREGTSGGERNTGGGRSIMGEEWPGEVSVMEKVESDRAVVEGGMTAGVAGWDRAGGRHEVAEVELGSDNEEVYEEEGGKDGKSGGQVLDMKTDEPLGGVEMMEPS